MVCQEYLLVVLGVVLKSCDNLKEKVVNWLPYEICFTREYLQLVDIFSFTFLALNTPFC